MRTHHLATVALGAFLLAPSAAVAQTPRDGANKPSAGSTPPGFREEFLEQFNTSMSKFVALADALPAEKYSWSPGTGVMPVAQVYAHVARYNYSYPATAMHIAAPPGLGLDTLEKMRDKAQVLALLRRSGDHVRDAVTKMPDAQLAARTTLYGRDVAQWAVLLQLLAHMNEHLGQSIAYARSNGIVPPWSQ